MNTEEEITEVGLKQNGTVSTPAQRPLQYKFLSFHCLNLKEASKIPEKDMLQF